ncbi:hypothetical protein RQP46_003910 [Phenoliferia psychrophenolica]
MLVATLLPSVLALATAARAQAGYGNITSTVSNDTALSFGKNYAVLNLDMITGLVAGVNGTAPGDAFISSVVKWIDAVHAVKPPPLTIFTRIYFSTPQKPEVGPNAPFGAAVGGLGNVTAANAITEVWPAFNVTKNVDVVLQKTRYYAGAGNGLEEILRTQGIDTVVLSGTRTSGVIISTAYRLFDLDYKVYIISDNVIEAVSDPLHINKAILEGAIPKLPANVITLDQAMRALNASGPVNYAQ